MAKQRLKWGGLLLILAILVLFWLRMNLATSIEPMSYDSYLTLRNVEHIKETGRPIMEDRLSITGQTRVGSPLFAYILAVISFIGPFMYKVIPNLFMVLLLIPIYFITYSFTKNTRASLIAVVLAGTAPAVFSSYLNTPVSTPLAIYIFFTILALLQYPNKYLPWIIGCTLFLTFLSPVIFVLVLALLMIIVLLRIEGFGVDKKINELFLFSLFLAVWFNVLVYKRAMFTEGLRVVWQNLPTKYAALQFGDVTFLGLIYGLGVVTFLFGVYGTYYVLFESRQKMSFTIVGAEIAVLFLMLTKVIELKLGLVLLSLLLSIMAGYGVLMVTEYITRTKMPSLAYVFGLLTLALFVFTALIPGMILAEETMQNAPSMTDVEGFTSLSNKLSRGVVLLTTVREGGAVQYYSGHATVTDDDFLMLQNGEELIRDIDKVYNTRFAVSIPGKAEKLGFTHILFTEDATEQYERAGLLVDQSGCISPVFINDGVTLYRILCRGGTA